MKSKGYTLLEVLVTMTIIAILVTILSPVTSKAIAKAKAIRCVGNLKNVSWALEMYLNDYGAYPEDEDFDLRERLAEYVDNERVFTCPNDPDPDGNSYEKLYVQRSGRVWGELFTLGCPNHRKNNVSVVLFQGASTHLGRSEDVILTDGDGSRVIVPGEEIKGGKLTFADGSTLKMKGPSHLSLIESFRNPGSPLYSLVRIRSYGPTESSYVAAKIEIHVAHGSKFELITPAAIAGVQGTDFTLEVSEDSSKYVTVITVSNGRVLGTSRGKARQVIMVEEGESREFVRKKDG